MARLCSVANTRASPPNSVGCDDPIRRLAQDVVVEARKRRGIDRGPKSLPYAPGGGLWRIAPAGGGGTLPPTGALTTDFPAAVIAQPTMPATASRWCAWRPTPKRSATSTAKTPMAAPKKRFCGCSNEPSPAKSSDCSPGPAPSTTIAICGLRGKPKAHPSHRRSPLWRPDNHRLAARTRTPTQRASRQPLPPVAHRRLTLNRNRSINSRLTTRRSRRTLVRLS
jgi:hypothetical protein